MTQPAAKRGPVSPGSFERFGNSSPGISATLKSIQQSARGVAEWIDGEATGAGVIPLVAHDHRGGIWGRPLGVGYSSPARQTDYGFSVVTAFFNVPDPRPVTGETLQDAAINGGYSYVDIKAFTDGQVGAFSLQASIAILGERNRLAADNIELQFGAPGGGLVWSTATTGLHLPPGLVRLEVRGYGLNTWQWLALVVPQR